jgi:hypothetical protein
VHDDVGAADLGQINAMLADLPHRPAVVLFRYHPGVPLHREPVYNIDAAEIDAAAVIRAHDLPGQANRKLFEYYAARQPQRDVYFVDRSPDGGPPTLSYAGLVTQLATSPSAAAIIPRSTTRASPQQHQEP